MTADELLQLAHSLNARCEAYAMVTVVRVAAPTSAYVGAQAIVTRDGQLTGWIGGGCATHVAIAAAVAAIASGEPKLVRIANDGDGEEAGVERHPMACASNGTIELFIQPCSPRSGLCVIGSTPAADEARFLANRLGIRLAATPEQVPVVLIATQGEGDADALAAALASPAPHVLMIASRRKAEKLREAMRMRGIGDAQLARLQAPAGPDAGAKTPAEIALVAMTGVLAALRGQVAAGEPEGAVNVQAMGTPPAPGDATEEPAGIFINPVCGVPVSRANAMHVERCAGEPYYFCCDGCWQTFRQNPEKYAAIRRASRVKDDR